MPHRSLSGGAIVTIALAIAAVIGLIVLTFRGPAPTPEDYIGKTTLSHRALPQQASLVTPEEYAQRLQAASESRDASEAAGPESSEAPEPESSAPAEPVVAPTPATLIGLPDPGGVFTFCAAEGAEAPALSAASQAALDAALVPFTEAGDTVGFLFMNLTNGKGVAVNIDELFYPASTVKAPFALFICQEVLDAGTVDLSDTLRIGYADSYLETGVSSLELKSLIEDAIVYSDNDAYRILRANFERLDYGPWLESFGITGDRYTARWYPEYSVRQAATLWLGLGDYLESGRPHAAWLGSLLADTEVSFIRTGLTEMPDTTVVSKAGWINEYEENATSDCGIVTVDGTSYLLCILSDAPDSERSEAAVSDLARTLVTLRAALDSH